MFHPALQLFIFFGGIAVLGVPHGAADVLVAARRAQDNGMRFSAIGFILAYLARMLAFALILFHFPILGATLFVLFSAYHFGETDLAGLRTDRFLGQCVALSYGLVILGIVLLGHADEVRPVLDMLHPTANQRVWIDRVLNARLLLLGSVLVFFFASAFSYFLVHPVRGSEGGDLIARLAVLTLLLHFMPLLLGFTFYFVIWHSLLSLLDILRFLQRGGINSLRSILQRMAVYSAAALAGIVMLALCGSFFASAQALVVAVILGLAVLTAPHLGVMHAMYGQLRSNA